MLFRSAGVNERMALYTKQFGITSTVEQTIDIVSEARKIRNKVDSIQYVNKNSGSVNGSQLPQFLDTVLKFEGARRYMELNDLLPSQNEAYADTPMAVYGVAYGHANDTIVKMSGRPDNVKFYDQTKAANSTAAFHKGNIFDTVVDDIYVIDDTDTAKNLKDAVAKMNGVDVTWSGDMLKLRRFCEHPPRYALSKVSLSLFQDQSRRTLVNSLLYPPGAKQPFASVRLRKFGKLHNLEVFLELSNHPMSDDTTWAQLMGDVMALSGVVGISNKIVMEYQNMGMRFIGNDAPSEIGKKTGARRQKGSLKSGEVWSAVIKSSVADMSWFDECRVSQDNKITGGRLCAGSIILELSDDYKAADYVDIVFKMAEPGDHVASVKARVADKRKKLADAAK